VRPRVENVFERQTFGRVHLRVPILRGSLQPLSAQVRLRLARLRGGEDAVPRQRFVEAEGVVQQHARAHPGAVEETAVVIRQEEPQRLHQVRGDAEQRLALPQVHAHQPEIEHFEIPQPAVNEPRRARGGAAAVIGFLEQRNAQPAQSGVARDARADDAAAGDQHIESSGEFREAFHQARVRASTISLV
jgi:hypothetical protein